MNRRRFAPVNDAEVEGLLSILERHPSGVPKKELARRLGFSDDRRIRAIAHVCRARSVAPVISTYSDVNQADVYKIASSGEEIETYLASERRRLANLEASIDGLEHLKLYGTRQRQGTLLEATA